MSLKTSDTGCLAISFIEQTQGDLKLKQVEIYALTFELAQLKNSKFSKSSA